MCDSTQTGLPITIKWCFDQNVKVMLGVDLTKRMCDQSSSLWIGRDVVANSQLALLWMYDSPWMGLLITTLLVILNTMFLKHNVFETVTMKNCRLFCMHKIFAFTLEQQHIVVANTKSCFWCFSLVTSYPEHSLFKALTDKKVENLRNDLHAHNWCIFLDQPRIAIAKTKRRFWCFLQHSNVLWHGQC